MGYRELKKRFGNALIGLFILFYALVIIALVGLIIAIFSQDPVTSAAAQGFGQGVKEVGLVMIGAMLAVVTSYLTTFITMDIGVAKGRDDLIIGFYYEIKALNKKLKDIPCNNNTHCLQYIISNKVKLCSDDSLYLVAKKDLFSLETPILEKILDLYSKLKFIDEITDFDPSVINTHGSPELLKIHEHIKEINENSIAVFKILEEEKKKME